MLRFIHRELTLHKEEEESGKAKYSLEEFDFEDNSVMVNMMGPEGTPYEKGYFIFHVYFPEHYPSQSVKVVPAIVLPHPCITQYRIGLEILENKNHKNKCTFLEVMDNITRLLETPEMGKAVNKDALDLFLNDREKFNEKVRAAVTKQLEKE